METHKMKPGPGYLDTLASYPIWERLVCYEVAMALMQTFFSMYENPGGQHEACS